VRCNVVPTQAEAKAGAMIFVPARDEWFHGQYIPVPEDRPRPLRLSAAAGTAALGAFAVVPCGNGRILRAAPCVLRAARGSAIPAANCRVHALQSVPAVRDAAVHYRPFMPTTDLRNVQARGVYWFALQVNIHEATRTGTYRGSVPVTLDECKATLPVEVEVVRFTPRLDPDSRTFGVMATGDCHDVYRSLSNVLPGPRRAQLSRQILKHVSAGRINASFLSGPLIVGRKHTLAMGTMADPLRDRVRVDGDGRHMIDVTRALRAMEEIQIGTRRYRDVLGPLVKDTNKLAARCKLNSALYCGHLQRGTDLPRQTRVAQVFRELGGKPALSAQASVLMSADTAGRAELLKALDTLILTHGSRLLALTDEFKKDGPKKTLLLRYADPDTYVFGFYCWGVGADGAYLSQIFASRPLFNGFWFDGRSLLTPTENYAFEPTLAMLRLEQGIADYDLARQCELLVASARERNLPATDLEKILTEIRLTADKQTPSFDRARGRTGNVAPDRLDQWRSGLVREAVKLLGQMGA